MYKAAVVPGYYLVCYNFPGLWDNVLFAVVPGYYLVCYNIMESVCRSEML